MCGYVFPPGYTTVLLCCSCRTGQWTPPGICAHFHKLVSMVCPGRKMVPAAVHATPQFQFGLVRTPNEKWEELVSTAPGSRLWFGLVRNFGENWEEPGCPRRYIPHQCPDLAPRWDLDGSHLGRCKFKKKSSRVRSICEYCEHYLHVLHI